MAYRQLARRCLNTPASSVVPRRRPISSSSTINNTTSSEKPTPPPSAKAEVAPPESIQSNMYASSESRQQQQHRQDAEQKLPPSLERLTNLYSESSGVTELTALKSAVTDASRAFDAAVRSVTDLRRSVDLKTHAHDEANRRHASMLMKRDTWDDNDATRFAEATGAEVRARRDLADARETLRKAEDDVGHKQVSYMDAMRRRYHEEQLWQDKWRVLSTYWTWGLIGLNSVIFVGGQVFHYRRESGRLKRIEELIIGEKELPWAALSGQKHMEGVGDDNTAVIREENDEEEATAVTVDMSPNEMKSEIGDATAGDDADVASARHASADESSLSVMQSTQESLEQERAHVDQREVDLPENRALPTWWEKAQNALFPTRRKTTRGELDQRNEADGHQQQQQQQQHIQKGNNVPIWNDATRAVSSMMLGGTELHLPSAAIGAAAGATGFLILSCLAGGRK